MYFTLWTQVVYTEENLDHYDGACVTHSLAPVKAKTLCEIVNPLFTGQWPHQEDPESVCGNIGGVTLDGCSLKREGKGEGKGPAARELLYIFYIFCVIND